MNSRKPPQDDKYKIAICLDRIWNIVFFSSIIITILQNVYVGNRNDLFLKINSFVLVILFFLEYIRGKNISEATIIRRKNLFDTTFNLNRIKKRTDEFYDNHEINNKMIKLFANNHESIFFTKEISSIMLRNQYIIIGAIGILFLISVFNSGITEMNSITLGLLLSYFGLGRTLDIKSVCDGASNLFEESLRIANDMELGIKETNKAEMLEIIINYESILSSMNFVLSECIYNRKKTELTECWLEIKRNYKVYNDEITKPFSE